jgi:cytoskeleton protein RodZ
MKDEPTSAAATGREEPLAGLRLADARRARKLSLNEVANELHLDPQKVTALEQNRFSELGAPVFVKGYLKKYAGILGISPDPVLADYRRLEAGADEPPVMAPPRRPAPAEASLGAWLTVLLVLAVGGLGAWLWQSGFLDRMLSNWIPGKPVPAVERREDPAPDAPATGRAADEDPAEAGPGASPGPETVAVEAPAEDPVTVEPAAEAPPEPVLAAPESAPAPAGQVALTLSFADDCWTEVSDAAGDRLFFGLGRAGDTVSVTGSEPLRVLLGNYAAVTLTVDGEAYAIPRSGLRGETARFAIGEASQ